MEYQSKNIQMFVNLPIEINIEIYNLLSYESFAPTCKFALVILNRDEIWKLVCEKHNKKCTKKQTYLETFRSPLNPYWQWHYTGDNSSLYTTRPFTMKYNTVTIKINKQDMNQCFCIGIKRGNNDIIYVTFRNNKKFPLTAGHFKIKKTNSVTVEKKFIEYTPIRIDTLVHIVLSPRGRFISVYQDDDLLYNFYIDEIDDIYPYVSKLTGKPLELVNKAIPSDLIKEII